MVCGVGAWQRRRDTTVGSGRRQQRRRSEDGGSGSGGSSSGQGRSGSGEEGWNGERYGAFHDWESWRHVMTSAGFVELTHFYRPPGLPREQQPWLASVWRKPAASGSD